MFKQLLLTLLITFNLFCAEPKEDKCIWNIKLIKTKNCNSYQKYKESNPLEITTASQSQCIELESNTYFYKYNIINNNGINISGLYPSPAYNTFCQIEQEFKNANMIVYQSDGTTIASYFK